MSRRLAGALVAAPVIGYRRLISPLIMPRCRYYPSCSSYALEAVRTFGAWRGLVLAGWRLQRCNPLSDGGIDNVSDQRLFRHRDGSGCSRHGQTGAAA